VAKEQSDVFHCKMIEFLIYCLLSFWPVCAYVLTGEYSTTQLYAFRLWRKKNLMTTKATSCNYNLIKEVAS